MAAKTDIEWTESTWAPMAGCTKLSPGCRNCYAASIAHRFNGTKAWPNGFNVTLHPGRLDIPLRWRRPRRIFVCSTGDLFHDDVPDTYIARVFAVMAAAPRHTFQVLTKRHARMRSLLSSPDWPLLLQGARDNLSSEWNEAWDDYPTPPAFATVLPNVWLGVSAEDQQWAKIRGDALRQTPAAVRFFSCEPLLGPIDDLDLTGIDWVIAGGETGRDARPMHPDWVTSLWEQCGQAGVAFLFKQWGDWTPYCEYGTGTHMVEASTGETLPIDAQIDRGSWSHVRRVGKKAAGRILLGRTWDQYPEAVSAL